MTWIAVSLERVRPHALWIVVGTRSEQAESLDPMLYLDVAQQTFRLYELANKNENLLICLRFKNKVFRDT